MDTQLISVRKPQLDFTRPIDRFYFAGNPVKSHLFNALNLLFPDGERFFVKSVHDHQADIHDPQLKRDIRAFAGQEGQHAHHHERFFTVLEQQGYKLGGVMKPFKKLAAWSRDLPRGLRLSITAGAEHYTATLASLLLELDMLEGCDPTMRDLMTWHAVEEIEHKHVAYDVFTTSHPRGYLLRILGFMLATVLITWFTFIGLRMLFGQDLRNQRITRAEITAARKSLRMPKERAFRNALIKQSLKYFVPGFHPNQQDDRPLLERFVPQIAL
jgi:uncharacterized protein